MKSRARKRWALALCSSLGACATVPMLPTGVEAWASRESDLGTPTHEELWFVERSGEPARWPTSGLLVRNQSGEVAQALADETHVSARVVGRLARVVLLQEYTNPFEESVEAELILALPMQAAVSDFVLRIGERRIRGVIRERDQAQRMFLEAQRQGYLATLLTQDRSDALRQRLSHLGPAAQVGLQLEYDHVLAETPDGEELLFPWAMAAQGGPLSFELDLDCGAPIESIETPAFVERVPGTGPDRLRFEGSTTALGHARDLTVRYRVSTDGLPVLYLLPEASEGWRLFCLVDYAANANNEWGPIQVRDVHSVRSHDRGGVVMGRARWPSSAPSSGARARTVRTLDSAQAPMLTGMWARMHVAALSQRALGARGELELRALAEEIERTGLEYGLVTFLTALCVVDSGP